MTVSDFSSGTALGFALISAASIERSLAFYRDVIGLTPSPVANIERTSLGYRRGESGAARVAMCSDRGGRVGRVLLIEYAARGAECVRLPGDRTTRGLWNLNFYARDLRARSQELADSGYEFWADPVTYHLGEKAGTATEAMFEGPDGVAINLVEPEGDASTFTGRIKAQLEWHGGTPQGFTPVTTTANCVHDLTLARCFYEQVLGMRVVLDEILSKPETNRFLDRPLEARTHTMFLSGNHFFGKVSLNQPLNWPVPDRVKRAFAPRIGYLAQGFIVEDLSLAADACARVGVEDAHRIELNGLPDLDGCAALQVKVPGSGATVLLVAPGSSNQRSG